MDALEVAHRFLSRDTSHRVSQYVAGVSSKLRDGRLHTKFEGVPDYGIVSSLEEIPWATSWPYKPNQGTEDYTPWLHYVDQDKYVYFPHMHRGSAYDCDAFRVSGATYHLSDLLIRTLWIELQEFEPLFPEVPGMELVLHEDREQDFHFLVKSGYHIQMGGYTEKGTVLGTNRLLATGFITRFGFPGEETRVVNKLDVSAELIRRIEGIQPSNRKDAVVDMDVTRFIHGLKDECYSIQNEHGPFAAKYAWEVYKKTARFLKPYKARAS